VQGLTIEASGTVVWQWVTFFVFGNLFGGFWLVLAALNAFPQVAYHFHQLLVKLGLAKANTKQGRHAHAPRPKQEQQQQQDSQQQQPAARASLDNAPAGSIRPATSVAKQATFQRSSSLAPGGQLTPLRSMRSRPVPPAEICMEQTISPRTSLPLSPRNSLTPKVSGTVGTPLGGVGAASHRQSQDSYSGDGGAGAAAAPAAEAQDVVVDDDQVSVDTEDSSMETETVLVKLEWRNLCYAVKSATGLRLIVQGVYGCANPQELQGLMGPSGAGKSTLMDLLSKRTDPTGAAAAEAALQQQQRGLNRLKTLTSHHRSSDGTGVGSGDGGAGHGEPAHHTVSVAGLQSTIHAGDSLKALESQLLVNGAPLSRKAFMKLSAYVPQHDNLVPTMTTLEAVSFYAGIILPPETSAKTKKARILRVLALMGLSHTKDTIVGGMLPGGIQLRGLSGGERKRLAIACGVVAGPSLVFLDEPTSGLDSFAALNVVLFLKSMATSGGATLIASLHQPRSAIWGQLDQITLMANGRLMYTGPTDELTKWFTSLGYDYDPGTHGMASDWALDLVSLGFTKPQQGTRQQNEQGEEAPAAGLGGHGSMRYRGLAAVASGSRVLQGLASMRSMRYQQQDNSPPKVCMMSSKQELSDAAGAFLRNLRVLHPSWFTDGAGVEAANGDGYSSSAPGLAPIRVREPAAGAADTASRAVQRVDTLGDDTAASPFIVQDSLDDGAHGPQEEPLQLTSTEVLEQRKDGDVGVWHSVRGGWRKYVALLWRELLITTRNPADIGGRMMTFTYVALLSGLVAYNTSGGADSIMQRISSCYAVLSFYLLMPFVFMSLFTSDKRFFAADTTARLYHPFQYYMAKVTVTLPFNMIVAVVFHMVYYGMIGMRHGVAAMGKSCVISVLMGLTAMQAVYCCAIVASSQDLAFVYAIAWTALNLLVNPYMALFNLYSLGWGFSWLRFFSPYNYAWQALVKIELSGRGFDCNSGSGLRVLGLIPDLLPQGGNFNQVRAMMNNLGQYSTNRQCVASGNAVVDMYTTGLSFGAVVGILFGYFVLFLSVTYWVVYRSSKRRGPSL